MLLSALMNQNFVLAMSVLFDRCSPFSVRIRIFIVFVLLLVLLSITVGLKQDIEYTNVLTIRAVSEVAPSIRLLVNLRR